MKAGGNIGDGKTDENGEYPDCKLEGSYLGSHCQSMISYLKTATTASAAPDHEVFDVLISNRCAVTVAK
jgi:hypothetical protein